MKQIKIDLSSPRYPRHQRHSFPPNARVSLRNQAILLLLAFALGACSPTPNTQVEPDAVSNSLNAPIVEGRLHPVAVTTLAFASPGRVAEVVSPLGENAAEGDAVVAGQVLARLEVPELERRQLELARAQAELLNAQQSLDSLRAEAPAAYAQALLSTRDLAIQLRETGELLEEARAAEGTGGEDTPDDLLIPFYEASLEALSERLRQGEREGARWSPELDERDKLSPFAPALARLDLALAGLAAAEASLRPVELIAPWDGTLTTWNVRVGEVVAAGAPLATLADLSTWIIKTENLTELDVAALQIGDQVRITFDALPDDADGGYRGMLQSIRGQFEEKRGDITYTATIAVDGLPAAARWGMTALLQFGE